MWIVYLLIHNKTEQKYIGLTRNLKERLNAHNKNRQKATIRTDGSWELVYAEAYASKDDAIVREKRLKHHGSAKRELYKRVDKSFEVRSGAGRSESISGDCLPKT